MVHRFSTGLDGVLPRQDIETMIREGLVSAARFRIEEAQIQPASLDLRLGEQAYRVQCSFLPGRGTVDSKLEHYTIHKLRLIEGAVFEPGAVYIIPLLEKLV